MFGREKSKGETGYMPPSSAGPATAPAAQTAPAASSIPAPTAAPAERAPGDSVLGPNLNFKGEVNFEDGLLIEGLIEGRVSGQGALTIGPRGRVQGDMMAASVFICGAVQGNVTAADRLELASTGSIFGDIKAARLIVAEGAKIVGRIEIGADSMEMPPAMASKSEKKEADALEKVF
jgi:cytoskeletal protein CcmA (bactofilin family)